MGGFVVFFILSVSFYFNFFGRVKCRDLKFRKSNHFYPFFFFYLFTNIITLKYFYFFWLIISLCIFNDSIIWTFLLCHSWLFLKDFSIAWFCASLKFELFLLFIHVCSLKNKPHFILACELLISTFLLDISDRFFFSC